MPAPLPRRPTLRAVAQLAEVSQSTVSFILNGRAAELRIPLPTRHKVLQAAKTLGYEANYFARSLRAKASRSIAFLWETDAIIQEDRIVRQITEHALSHDYIVNFFAPRCRHRKELLTLLQELSHRQIDGIIFRPSDTSNLQDSCLTEALDNFPATVIIAHEKLQPAFDLLHHDARAALTAAVLHLRAEGRQHLGLMHLPPALLGIVKTAWQKAGGQELITPAAPASMSDATENLVEAWLDHALPSSRLDAVICHTDVHAFAAINGLRRRGHTVPDDVAVIGFGDTIAATCFSPALATIARNEETAANRALGLLLSRLQKPSSPLRHETVEMEFLLRNSALRPSLAVMKTSHANAGFSLLELFIAILLVAVIAVLGFSAFSTTRERSNQMKCVSNLRNWGVAINLYSNDNMGYLPMNRTPRESSGTKLFFEDLAPYGNYRYPLTNTVANRALNIKSILACPAEETLRTSIPFCYALNIDLDYTTQGDKAKVRYQSLRNAASYVLMSDSYSTSTFYTHTRAKFENFSQCNRRHNGIPNFLYADGHVAPFAEEMKGWGDSGGNNEVNNNRWFANGINPTRR